MWNFVAQSGLANAPVDFTDSFVLLGVGLAGMVVLSAGAIAFTAIRHYISQRTESTVKVTPTSGGHQEAA